MTGLSDYAARKTLDHWTGKASLGSAPTVYLGLFSAVGTDAGTGFTELSGNGYARVATGASDWNSASGTAPASTTNAGNILFPTATALWTAAIVVGAFDAVSGGNLLWWDYLGDFPWLPFSCTNGSPGVLDAPGHGLTNGDNAVVTAEYGGALPSTGGSWSGLHAVAGVSGDTFNLGVNTTGTGNGLVRKVGSVAVPAGSAFVFTGGTPGILDFSLA